MKDTIQLTFEELAELCEQRVVTGAWFDADKAPPWDWTCIRGDFDSEEPKRTVLGNEQECIKENCPIWRRKRHVETQQGVNNV